MISWLSHLEPEDVPAEVVEAGARHPMRMVTRAAAAEVGVWTADTRDQVRDAFDHLAGEWHTRHTPDRLAAVQDALDRGGPLPDHGTWLELGCGDGWATGTIARSAPRLVASDLSSRMLAAAARAIPDDVALLRADANRLPLDDHSITTAVLMNMLLFPTELDRVIAPGGALVWINSRGEATPIHLMPEQVAAAMPGRWGGTAGRHGTALWTVLRRLG